MGHYITKLLSAILDVWKWSSSSSSIHSELPLLVDPLKGKAYWCKLHGLDAKFEDDFEIQE